MHAPTYCTRAGPKRDDAAYLAFSSDGLTFRMPTSTECYLTSKDDSQNPIVWYQNQTLWYGKTRFYEMAPFHNHSI
jgi:hypothetical protein